MILAMVSSVLVLLGREVLRMTSAQDLTFCSTMCYNLFNLFALPRLRQRPVKAKNL